jgi:two-component system sensor kinase FixL
MRHMRNRAAATDIFGGRDVQRVSPTGPKAFGLFEWNLADDILQWADGDEARFGLQPGSITNLASWSNHVVPEDVVAAQAEIAEASRQNREQFSFRYRLRGGDGRLRTVEGVARCIYDADGTLIRISGVNIDVSDQVAREAMLQAREAQLDAVFATMPSAMVVVDSEGIIQSLSAEAERVLGYGAGDLVGQNMATLVAHGAQERLRTQFDRHRESRSGGATCTPFELVAQCSSGREFPVELCIAEVIVDAEQRYIIFIRDLSEREAAEQAANDLRNELAQVGRGAAMGELAASLAHELNQPLSATANFLAATVLLVERGGDRDKVAELVALANDQIQRAGSIIRNIRDFIVKRDVEIGIEPVEKTVRDSVSLVLVGAARIDVQVRYAFEQTGQFMLADRVQIQQVLVNLLRNAAEALQDQPKHRRTILIAVRSRPGDMIEISVSDTGDGIDARILEKLFTPLSSTKGSEGMGLGLSICRRIVEAHGGTLSAENRSAGGATFRFTLPAGDFDMPADA